MEQDDYTAANLLCHADNDDSRGPELYTEKIGAEAARYASQMELLPAFTVATVLCA